MQKAKIFNEPHPTSSVTLYYMLLYLMKMYIIIKMKSSIVFYILCQTTVSDKFVT